MTGPAPADTAAVAAFWAEARAARPDVVKGERYRTRAIGTTRDTMSLILQHVRNGEKRGTFSLPWLHEKVPGSAPVEGDYVILLDFDGKPGALVTTMSLEHLTYQTITAAHTAIDGPSVRELEKWQAIHKPHWTKQLADHGLAFADDMPVVVEHFTLLYPTSAPGAAKARGLDALPPGPQRPSVHALDSFWRAVAIARPDLQLPDSYEVRWIGIDAPTTEQIFQFITAGTKVGTFRLPWQLAANNHPPAKVGDPIVLIAWDGTPRLAIRITGIEQTTFGAIDQRYTSLDGPPVQDVNVWKPLHREFWSKDLARIGRTVTDDMPVTVERFELIYPKP
jgi:uncharacterized protein YhfF